MTTYKGQCLCGQLRWTIEGLPQATVVCHCLPCRVTSSCSGSNNFIVPRDKVKLEGEIKKFTRKGDSGKDVTYQSCPVCPTLVAVDAEILPDAWIIKAGTCQDEQLLRDSKPNLEAYVKNRYPWVKPTGAPEKETQ